MRMGYARHLFVPWLALGAFLGATTASVGARADTASPKAPTERQTDAMAMLSDPNATWRSEEILSHWLTKSPEVAAWRARIGSARFDIVTARLLPNPELSLAVNALAAGTPPDGQVGYEAQVSQPLPIFGQVGARIADAESRVDVAEAEVLLSIWTRATEIQSAMVTRAFADARRVMLEGNLAELERIRVIVAARTAQGANSPYDLLRVQTAMGGIRAALQKATVERDRGEANVVALVADDSMTSAPVTRAGLAHLRGVPSEETLLASALARRPDLMLAKRGALASSASAKRLSREAIPTPRVFVGGYLVQRAYGVQVTAGVALPLPLFDRNQGERGRALAEKQEHEWEARATSARIRAEVHGAFRARRAAQASLDDFQGSSMASASELLRRAETTYQAGSFSIAELFDAYQTIWDVRAQELELELERANAEVELARASVLLPVLDSHPRR